LSWFRSIVLRRRDSGIAHQLVGVHAHSAHDTARRLRPARGPVVALGDLCVHALCLLPGLLEDLSAHPPGGLIARRDDREVRVVRTCGESDVLVEEAGVATDDWTKKPARERGDRPGDERGRLGAAISRPRAEVSGEADTGLGPDRRVQTPHVLAGVVEGHALLLRSADLDVGLVHVDARAQRDEPGLLLFGKMREPPPNELARRLLDPGEDLLLEALRPPDERRPVR